MAKEINILNFKCSSLNLLLMNIVEVNMSTEKEYQEKKEVESNQVFIINTQDCIIVWWVQYSWHTLQKSKTLGYDNKNRWIDGEWIYGWMGVWMDR